MERIVKLLLVTCAVFMMAQLGTAQNIKKLIPNNTFGIMMITANPAQNLDSLSKLNLGSGSEEMVDFIKKLASSLDVSATKPVAAVLFGTKVDLSDLNDNITNYVAFLLPIKGDRNAFVQDIAKAFNKPAKLKSGTYTLGNMLLTLVADNYIVVTMSKKGLKNYQTTKSMAKLNSPAANKVSKYMTGYGSKVVSAMLNTDIFSSYIQLINMQMESLSKYNFFNSLDMIVLFGTADILSPNKGSLSVRVILKDAATLKNIFMDNKELSGEKFLPLSTEMVYGGFAIQPKFIADIFQLLNEYAGASMDDSEATPEMKKQQELNKQMTALLSTGFTGRASGAMYVGTSETFEDSTALILVETTGADVLKKLMDLAKQIQKESVISEKQISGKTVYVIQSGSASVSTLYAYAEANSIVISINEALLTQYIAAVASGSGSFSSASLTAGPDNQKIWRGATGVIKSPLIFKAFKQRMESSSGQSVNINFTRIYMHFGANILEKFMELQIYAE